MATHRTRREKRLTYRDMANAPLEAHAEHWRTFTFEAGPWLVQANGPFGRPRVWASSEAEGKRVLRHAAAIAGWDLEGPEVEIVATRIEDQRLGKGGTYRVAIKRGLLLVSKRDGSSGAPESVA